MKTLTVRRIQRCSSQSDGFLDIVEASMALSDQRPMASFDTDLKTCQHYLELFCTSTRMHDSVGASAHL